MKSKSIILKPILFIFLFLFITEGIAQDKVYMLDNTVKIGKILKVTDKKVEFDLDGAIPFITIDRIRIAYILYSDGTKVVINDENNKKGTEKIDNEIEDSKSKTDFDAGIKLGYFFPTEDAVNEIYGGGIIVATESILWTESGFGVGSGLEYFKKSGTPILIDPLDIYESATADISIMPITISLLYRTQNKQNNNYTYFGTGLGVYFFKENATTWSEYGFSTSLSVSSNPLGFHVLGGIEFEITQKISFVIEARFSSASVEGQGGLGGDSVNIGGFTILSGVLF